MTRRTFLATVSGGLLAAPVTVGAQQTGTGPVVGFLHPGVSDPAVPAITALQRGLHALGYVEGQNIHMEY